MTLSRSMLSARHHLAFRCDGGAEIGLGHVVGCLRLAKLLEKEAGIGAHFVVRENQAVISMVREAGYPLDIVPAASGPVEDFQALTRMAGERAWRGIVTNFCKDDLERYAPHFHLLKDAGLKLIFMDHPIPPSCWLADLLINALPHPDYQGYDPAKHPACFDGLEYFIPGEGPEPSARLRDGPVGRILVAMGGGDGLRLTSLVLEGLRAASFGGVVDVVVGAAFPHAAALEETLTASGLRGEVSVNVGDMPERMLRADLGFSALGLTTYEMACYGLPVGLIAGNALNAVVAEKYARTRGAADYLGTVDSISSGRVASWLHAMQADPGRRAEMSVAGRGVGSRSGFIVDEVTRLVAPLNTVGA